MTGVEPYVDSVGQFRWRFKASNGRILADSAEGYRRERDCLHGADVVTGHQARTITDAQIKAAAEALWSNAWPAEPWSEANEHFRTTYLYRARVALEAALRAGRS